MFHIQYNNNSRRLKAKSSLLSFVIILSCQIKVTLSFLPPQISNTNVATMSDTKGRRTSTQRFFLPESMVVEGSNNINQQPWRVNNNNKIHNPPTQRNGITRQYMAPAVASVLAGSIAGAIGVGVAFPLDTLKTKSQVLGNRISAIQQNSNDGNCTPTASAVDRNMFQLINLILQTEGISGFYGGVRTMMVGQAMIKAVAFSANTTMLSFLEKQFHISSQVMSLIIAACFAGFVTSFLVAPFERIKIMMQADDKGMYKNEIECVNSVLKTEGWSGLFSRGLIATISREVPSYGIYFVVYGLLINSTLATMIGSTFAPLFMGATAGMACWAPVYPIDVVKTLLQNTKGDDTGSSSSAWEVTQDLYREGGINAFFDGITPKMLRAAVNHAVTFWIYELIMVQLG